MTLRAYLILMSIGAAICWAAWFYIIGVIDPNEAKIAGFFFFYSVLFMALTGTFSVIGFLVKRRLAKDNVLEFNYVKQTFRQGAIYALAAIFFLLLLQLKLLKWWSAILILLLFIGANKYLAGNRRRVR